ncbi:hypothetical protein SK128_026412, partial [Halocaridina rubra]
SSVIQQVSLRGEKIIEKYGGAEVVVKNPSHWPEVSSIVSTFEPIVMGTIITP